MNIFKRREPDFIIGQNYLLRWYLIRRNKFMNIYLHKFNNSDDDRALHDHPWYSISILITGELKEHTCNGVRFIPRFIPIFRFAKLAHRLELVKGPAVTIFITGPKIREWGFHCPNGWKKWQDFTDASGKHVGDGCN